MLGGTSSQNRHRKIPFGYTIIEVLIVLAVSGMMFVIAVNFINGKQAKAAFTQGTNELASQIQNTIEQVSNGQFSDIPLNCTFNGSSTIVNSGIRPPGTNSTCIFLGKMLRFTEDGETYETQSLAAGRVTRDAAGNPTTPTLGNTHPVVVSSLTRTQRVPQQLLVKDVRVTNAAGVAVSAGAFGFTQGLGTVDNASFSFKSGAQTITMVYSSASTLDYAKSATICLTDNTRYAQILVGGDNASQLSVKVKVVPTEDICRNS